MANQKSTRHWGRAARYLNRRRGQGSAVEDQSPMGLDLYTLPEVGMEPRAAYETIRGEMELNFSPSLNLATFVNTWMDDEAMKLAHESLEINFIDRAEYPMTTEIHKRDVWMTAKMLHATIPDKIEDNDFIGTGTVGSSEAVMLGILAHKQRWRDAKYGDQARRPNIVIGGAYQICWEKVFKFFEVEPRIIPVIDGKKNILTKEDIQKAYDDGTIDDNTIAIGVICGTTFTGEMDEIDGINGLVKEHNDRRQPQSSGTVFRVPIHVDAASGGFILPFSAPDLPWDFRLSEVLSINVSNHKYGLVCPGMGTVVFRDISIVPNDLFTKVDYLGGVINDYALSFSRGSWQVLAQYYNFLSLGRSGYGNIMDSLITRSSKIVDAIQTKYPDWFVLKSQISDDNDDAPKLTNDDGAPIPRLLFPVIVFDLSGAPFRADALSDRLKQDGWFIPAYPYPHPERENTSHPTDEPHVLFRMVIRENFSDYLADILLKNLDDAVKDLTDSKVQPKKPLKGFKRGLIC